MNKPLRGFAALSPERRQEIARKGGSASGGNFAKDKARAARMGQIGGQQSGGNFANNPKRASEAGRAGGKNSWKNRKGTE